MLHARATREGRCFATVQRDVSNYLATSNDVVRDASDLDYGIGLKASMASTGFIITSGISRVVDT